MAIENLNHWWLSTIRDPLEIKFALKPFLIALSSGHSAT